MEYVLIRNRIWIRIPGSGSADLDQNEADPTHWKKAGGSRGV